ncbi:MucR family transcriptional regulator [Croceicoccus marinus]|uniref:MucR family transcriptional regulator n=1 Tax=Croceicoccus marinus TaxID=450378 RepID=A0A217EZ16_9SPHN|nr:MucR family transcriptional regulator [Croceicoccus marinus]ARU18381.1 hypothetical protein A9D14_18740 [Croceicoccus marinus]
MNDFDARRASLELVTAFVNNNRLTAAELPKLLGDVFKAISDFEAKSGEEADLDEKQFEADAPIAPAPAATLGTASTAIAELSESQTPAIDDGPQAPTAQEPAVSVETSLADPSVIVSLITGEKFKMLKRHLKKHGVTEAEYRKRFDLPDDYPMVAPAYSKLRREVATKMHQNGKEGGSESKAAEEPGAATVDEPSKAPKRKVATANKTSQGKVTSSQKKARASRAASARALKRDKGPEETETTETRAAPENAPDVSSVAHGAPDANPASNSLPEGMQTDMANADNKPLEPATEKPVRKRRMARQPADESLAANTTPALTDKPENADASSADTGAKAKSAGRKTSKARGGGATKTTSAGAGVEPKSASKDRKKLSPVFR